MFCFLLHVNSQRHANKSAVKTTKWNNVNKRNWCWILSPNPSCAFLQPKWTTPQWRQNLIVTLRNFCCFVFQLIFRHTKPVCIYHTWMWQKTILLALWPLRDLCQQLVPIITWPRYQSPLYPSQIKKKVIISIRLLFLQKFCFWYHWMLLRIWDLNYWNNWISKELATRYSLVLIHSTKQTTSQPCFQFCHFLAEFQIRMQICW